jgi:HEAT repeat protein
VRELPRHCAVRIRSLAGDQALAARIRATLLRGVARLDLPGAFETIRVGLSDPEPEVRDAAVSLIAELELPEGRELLAHRLARESNPLVVRSIQDAIESFDA